MKVISRYIDCIKSNIEFHVGKDAEDNFKILNDAMMDDIWFHIHGSSSAHVIAKIPSDLAINKKQMLRVIKQGALICKEVSKYASEKNVKIIYAPVNDVIPTEKAGTVIVSNAKYIEI